MLSLFTAAAQASDVLFPLVQGNQWALSNPITRLPAYMTVTESKVLGGTTFVKLRVDVPFSSATLILAITPNGIQFEGVSAGEARSYFDDGLPLFPAAAKTADTWSNEVGTVTVIADDLTITTPAGVFEHCRHFKLDFRIGGTQEWFLAPGLGPVRFGSDAHPFLLDIANVQPHTIVETPTLTEGACPKIGLDANPSKIQGYSGQSKEDRLTEAIQAGHGFQHVSSTWASLEPSPGSYSFDEIKQWVSWAEKYGLDITLTIKTVDTLVAAAPDDLKDKALDDGEVLERFRALLRALVPELGGRVKWIQLANEVDTYFLNSPQKLPAFIVFYESGKAIVKELQPDMSVGVVFAHNDYRRSNAVFNALMPLSDHLAFTYYPLRSDLTMRQPSVPATDIAEIVDAARNKPVLFTEIGYATAEAVSAGMDAQREFYENTFAELRSYPGKIVGASFFLMNEIPAEKVSELAGYYGFSPDSLFTAYLGSLGLHDLDGVAKPAWNAFAAEAIGTRDRVFCTSPSVLPAP